jgi:hypothetical protein
LPENLCISAIWLQRSLFQRWVKEPDGEPDCCVDDILPLSGGIPPHLFLLCSHINSLCTFADGRQVARWRREVSLVQPSSVSPRAQMILSSFFNHTASPHLQGRSKECLAHLLLPGRLTDPFPCTFQCVEGCIDVVLEPFTLFLVSRLISQWS